MPHIFVPSTANEYAQLRDILSEYLRSLPIGVESQNFELELIALPGGYAGPRGTLLLASVQGAIAGCCLLRPIDTVDDPNACEMKRLYVRPAFRRIGLGRRLVEAVMEAARVAGYACVLLDTLDAMESARALYAELGFVEIPPYYHNSMAGAHYLKTVL